MSIAGDLKGKEIASMDEKEVKQKAYDLSRNCEYKLHGCSQCVILALQDVPD